MDSLRANPKFTTIVRYLHLLLDNNLITTTNLRNQLFKIVLSAIYVISPVIWGSSEREKKDKAWTEYDTNLKLKTLNWRQYLEYKARLRRKRKEADFAIKQQWKNDNYNMSFSHYPANREVERAYHIWLNSFFLSYQKYNQIYRREQWEDFIKELINKQPIERFLIKLKDKIKLRLYQLQI